MPYLENETLPKAKNCWVMMTEFSVIMVYVPIRIELRLSPIGGIVTPWNICLSTETGEVLSHVTEYKGEHNNDHTEN